MQTNIDFQHIRSLIETARADGREFLFEHETYALLANSGAESVPACRFIFQDQSPTDADLAALPGEKVVLKIVSPTIIHKTEAGGVKIVAKDEARQAMRAMLDQVPEILATRLEPDSSQGPAAYRNLAGDTLRQAIRADIRGVLLVQFMPPDSEAFGNELLVSLRRTSEFGTVLTAGLGGTDTELYAARFKKGQAVVSASVELTSPEAFFELFKSTIAYRKLTGLTRGQKRIVSDNQLRECFASFLEMGRAYGPANPDAPLIIEELEVNPFAFTDHRMIPLDGLCSFSAPGPAALLRPIQLVDKLLHPTSIGIIGVSASRKNFGRIILENILSRGFPLEKITIVRPGATGGDTIDGVACAPDLAAMGRVDLFILAVSADQAPEIIDELTTCDLAASVILIPGGLEERAHGRDKAEHMAERIRAAHAQGRGPVILGGNSLGVLSHPGHYDTIFVPDAKLPQKTGGGRGRVALISQSGGFLVTTASKFTAIDPSYMISIGNQMDLTVSDLVTHLACQDHLTVIAVYMEGFRELDGLAFCRAVCRAVACGKEVIFYKAGRTPEGQSATSGHTASVAGDYMVCESLVRQAGAMVAETFSQFEDLYQLASQFAGGEVGGSRLAAVSGAGFEAVGMADSIQGEDFALTMARFSPETNERLRDLFRAKKLDTLVQVANPLDINPASDDETHLRVAEILINDPGVDGLVMGLDPLSPAMRTLPDGMSEHDTVASEHSIAKLFPALVRSTPKPVVAVVDAGRLYDALARTLADGGVPVFRTCDRAVAALAKYMEGRLRTKSCKP